jgi:hypothetical protein
LQPAGIVFGTAAHIPVSSPNYPGKKHDAEETRDAGVLLVAEHDWPTMFAPHRRDASAAMACAQAAPAPRQKRAKGYRIV